MSPSITTRSYDLARTGVNNHESTLTATAVRTKGIVKLFSIPIPDDPRLEAQSLAVGGVRLTSGQTRDLILQATMGNWIYAFDAETGTQIWGKFLGRPITGTTAIDGHMTNVNWGILSTPVIDEQEGIIYACTWISADGTALKGQHFLVALRIADGSFAQPMLNLEGAVYAPKGLPSQKFVSTQRKQRAGLTLTQKHVLVPFGTISWLRGGIAGCRKSGRGRRARGSDGTTSRDPREGDGSRVGSAAVRAGSATPDRDGKGEAETIAIRRRQEAATGGQWP